MSEQTPKSFDDLEQETVESKFQEQRYMDSLMGGRQGDTDARTEKRREEAKAYDEHLRGLKDRDNDPTFKTDLKDEDVFNDSVTEVNPLQKKIDLLSQQIMEIEASYKDKNSADGDRLSTVVEKDLKAKKALRSKYIAKLQKESNEMLGIEDDGLLDEENVAQLRKELKAYDESKANDAAENSDEGSAEEENDGSENSEEEVPVVINTQNPEAPVDGNTPGTELVHVPREDEPEDEENKESFLQRHRRKLLGVAAIAAVGIGFAAGYFGMKTGSNDRSDNSTKSGQIDKNSGRGSDDKFMSQFKINDSFDHPGNKTAPGFEKGDTAPEAIEQLKKNFGHHPVLLAEAVYAYQNGISVDKAREHVDEINQLAKSFTDGDHLSAEGIKWAEKLGESLDNGSAHWVTQEEMQHSIWYNSGVEENGKFDKFEINSRPGFESNKILRITMGNGKVFYLKYNCENFLWYDDVKQSSSTTTTGGGITTTTEGWKTPKHKTPPTTDTPNTPKGPVKVDQEGTANTGGVEATGPGKAETPQQAGGNTNSQAEQQSDGSNKPAAGAEQTPKPGNASQGAGGETSSGSVSE